jgi:transcriptional regulator with XRE-family HTH domain
MPKPRAVPLAVLRRRKLLSLRDLAKKAGVTVVTLMDIENGRSRPRLMTIRKIAGALEVEPEQVQEFRDAIERGPHQLKLAA